MKKSDKVMEEWGTLLESEKVAPFSNGTEFMNWNSINCETCHKSNPDEIPGRPQCDIEIAFGLGTITGDCAKKYADRAGRGKGYRCLEWVDKDKPPPRKSPRRIKPAKGQFGLFPESQGDG